MSRSEAGTTVPFIDLTAGYLAHKSELDQALLSVVAKSDFVLGRATEKFETAFASYCGADYAVGCGNGTDALELVLMAAGIGPGDEVITVSHTFVATAAAIARVGATAVLVDVDADALLMDPSGLSDALSPRTAAIIAVHLYGSCAPIDPIRAFAAQEGLLLIEDAAQAHGARYRGKRAGALGDAATFSFYPSKNLGAFGDGGAVVTNDGDLAGKLRSLRDHGKSDKYVHQMLGRNSRLDGVQAAILETKLRHLDEENHSRRESFQAYVKGMSDRELPLTFVSVPADAEPVHHLVVARVNDRERVLGSMQQQRVGAGIHYPVPVHRQPAFKHLKTGGIRIAADLTETERAVDEIISLPVWPQMSAGDVERVLEVLQVATKSSS